MKQCYYPGCRNDAKYGYCREHKTKKKPHKYIKEYGYLYKTDRWKMESRGYLMEHEYCVMCYNKSSIVDHKISHRGDEKRFWNKDNWQALCKKCHGHKNAIDSKGLTGSSRRMG